MSKIIEARNLDFTYLPGTPYEHRALQNITFSLEQGDLLVLLGANGSGKSTLAQHLNGLLHPTGGSLTVCHTNITHRKSSRELWKKVSLVFQYPEQQIFQVTVFDEIAYGPRNLRLHELEVKNRVCKALEQVGLKPEEVEQLPPIGLSGGMKRRVAIAGMLALDPEILVLDEPMAGLDPVGRRLILDIIRSRQARRETTIVISHDLKDIMTLADKIAILDKGSLVFFGNLKELLEKRELLACCRFEWPEHLQLVFALAERGFKVETNVTSLTEAGLELLKSLA